MDSFRVACWALRHPLLAIQWAWASWFTAWTVRQYHEQLNTAIEKAARDRANKDPNLN